MRLFGFLAACVLLIPSAHAYASDAPSADSPAGVSAHRVGDALDYTVKGNIAQSISGHDAFGRKVDQAATPTTLDGSEHVAIKDVTPLGISLYRSGQLIAAVDGAKPQNHKGSGWTLVRADGSIARDNGNLGGVFLLPVVFLGERAVKEGDQLEPGDRWNSKLGTKLFGMTARPTISYSVDAQHLQLGQQVFSIIGEGSAPMREPVYSNSGEPLGYATGRAHVTLRYDYDRANHRIMSMEVEVADSLSLGTNKKPTGTVSDHQRYLVSLDPSTISQN